MTGPGNQVGFIFIFLCQSVSMDISCGLNCKTENIAGPLDEGPVTPGMRTEIKHRNEDMTMTVHHKTDDNQEDWKVEKAAHQSENTLHNQLPEKVLSNCTILNFEETKKKESRSHNRGVKKTKNPPKSSKLNRVYHDYSHTKKKRRGKIKKTSIKHHNLSHKRKTGHPRKKHVKIKRKTYKDINAKKKFWDMMKFFSH